MNFCARFAIAFAGVGAVVGVDMSHQVTVMASLSGPQCSLGHQFKYVAEKATEYINVQSWMTGHALAVSVVDDGSTPQVAWGAAQVEANSNTPPLAIVGPWSSGMCSTVQLVAENSELPTITYGATSPTISKKPYFMRTIPTDVSNALAILSLMRHFDWRQFGVLAPRTVYGDGFVEAITNGLSETDALKLKFTGQFSTKAEIDAEGYTAEIDRALKRAKALNFRVFVLVGNDVDAAAVMVRAKKLGMTGKGWVWIGPAFSWLSASTWELSPDAADVRSAMEGMIGLASVDPLDKLLALPGLGLTAPPADSWWPAPMQQGCAKFHSVDRQEAAFLFNALWLLAKRLSAAPADAPLSGAALQSALLGNGTASEFPPVSSPLLTANGGAIAIDAATYALADLPLDIVNMNRQEGGGYAITSVGKVENGAVSALDDKGIRWAGGGTDIPTDRGQEQAAVSAFYLTLVVLGLVLSFYWESALHRLFLSPPGASGLQGRLRSVAALMPASGATIITGMVFGAIISAISKGTKVGDSMHELKGIAEFDEATFVLILLPIIVFESGYALSRTFFFSQLGSILLFAIAGTMISTAVVGFFLYAGCANGTISTNLSLEEALAFAALISAIDPVATLAGGSVL
jgi:hypothetical protein